MADLNPLIRVRKHAVEQKQKKLAELYAQAEELEAEKADNQAKLDEEGRKLTDENRGDMIGYFSAYAEKVRAREKEIDAALATLESRIEFARDDMRGAFADLKKIEITQKEREKEERAAEDKKESDMLDEIAIESYRRKLNEDEGT